MTPESSQKGVKIDEKGDQKTCPKIWLIFYRFGLDLAFQKEAQKFVIGSLWGCLLAIWPQNGSREHSGPYFNIFLTNYAHVLFWICFFSRCTMSPATSCWLLLAMCFIIVRPQVCPFNCVFTVFFVRVGFQLVVRQASGNLLVSSML